MNKCQATKRQEVAPYNIGFNLVYNYISKIVDAMNLACKVIDFPRVLIYQAKEVTIIAM